MGENEVPTTGEVTALEESDRRRVGPRRSEASTNAVLVAAYTELSEHGWRDFSVDRVAKTEGFEADDLSLVEIGGVSGGGCGAGAAG